MPNVQTLMVVALPAEAKPIIHHFGLLRDNRAQQFPLYRNQSIMLVVSGVGRRSAGEATRWLGSREVLPEQNWINIGIAGHSAHPVGEAVLASEIHDMANGQRWSASLPTPLPCCCDPLTSVAELIPGYPSHGLFDMEAAGFYPAALGFTQPARIQCLKIVSDNPSHPTAQINARMVAQLIEKNMHTLQTLMAAMGLQQ